ELALKCLRSEDDHVKKLIQRFQVIYVRSFEFDKEGEFSAADINPIRKHLAGSGWSCLVSVHSKKNGGSDTDICLCQKDGKVLGMGILSVEAKTLTVVNILGSISLDDL